jgi:hypothetical protein
MEVRNREKLYNDLVFYMGLKEGIGLSYFSVTVSLWDNLFTFFCKGSRLK